jgi:uncharacterized membrane protein YdbT with pleckstrin-like domain
MFCTRCGKDNPDDAVYCQKCGKMLDAEEETRVASRDNTAIPDDGPSAVIFSISPTLMFVKLGYALAAIGAVMLVAIFSMFFSAYVSPWVAVLIGLLLLLIPAYFHFRQKMIKYSLTDSKIEIDEGLISRTTRNVPLRRIQDVTVSSTIPQRMLGFGDIVIDNASEDVGKVVLKNINSPRKYADALLKQMRRLDL